jgi:hypothetical protein
MMNIFVPASVIDRLRQFVALSFAIKVDHDSIVPDHYDAPSSICDNIGTPNSAPSEETTRRWYPVVGGLDIPVHIGKKGKTTMVVSTLQLHHTVTTVGYVLSERGNKVRPDLIGADKRTTGENVKVAKQRGEEVTITVDTPVCAFVCDTSLRAVTEEGEHSAQILACPVVIIECTYLEEEYAAEGDRRGHIVWTGGLRDVVLSTYHAYKSRSGGGRGGNAGPSAGAPVFILMHFSLRYSDDEIREFFRERSGLGAALTTSEVSDAGRKPHVVLWLDSGIEQLWFQDLV